MNTMRKVLAATVIAGGVLMAGAAQASDAVFGAVIGGGAGALIGQSMGGRDGAIVGGAIGAAAGAAAASGSQRYYGGVGYYPPAPVYRAPATVYYAPAPVYHVPAPVYHVPAPVYHVPAPVYYVSPRVVYRPAPVYVEYGGSRGHWKHKHGRGHDRQWQRGRDDRRGHYYR